MAPSSRTCVHTVRYTAVQSHRCRDSYLSDKLTYPARMSLSLYTSEDAKEKCGLRYATYRGLAQVSSWGRPMFAAIRLKKPAARKGRERLSASLSLYISKRVFRLAPEHPFFDRHCSTEGDRLTAAWGVSYSSTKTDLGWPQMGHT